MNGCSNKPLCVDSVESTAVCLKLLPAGCSKIRAVRTVTTTAAGCTRVVTYTALDPAYNPLTGYTMADEVPCGNGENLPFDCGTSSGSTPSTVPVQGRTCADALVPATANSIVQSIPHPDYVQKVVLCSTGAPAADREVVTLVNAAHEAVIVQYDVTVVPPAELSRWNTVTNAAEPTGPLFQPDDDSIEVVLVRGCLNGQPINGIQALADIATLAAPSVLGAVWQDPITGVWGAAPVGMIFGECLPAQCEPSTPVGVISTWGV